MTPAEPAMSSPRYVMGRKVSFAHPTCIRAFCAAVGLALNTVRVTRVTV